jgi:hypothetical protein
VNPADNRSEARRAGELADDVLALCRALDHGALQRMAEEARTAEPPRHRQLAGMHRSELSHCLARARRDVRRALVLVGYYPEPTAAEVEARVLARGPVPPAGPS